MLNHLCDFRFNLLTVTKLKNQTLSLRARHWKKNMTHMMSFVARVVNIWVPICLSFIDKGEHNVIKDMLIDDYRNDVLWKVLGVSLSKPK